MSKFDLLKSASVELSVVSLIGAKFIEQGADLIIQLENSSEDIVLNNFKVATASDLPIQLTLTDGTVVSLDKLQASIDAAAISNVAPAAGGGANGASGGGAAFATAIDDGIGNGLSIEGLLEGTELEFADESEREELVVLAEETIVIDPCNDLFDVKVAAYRDAFRDQPAEDTPNSFKYYDDGAIVDGDSNRPGNIVNFNSNVRFDPDIKSSFVSFNDVMDGTNLEGNPETIVGDQYADLMYGGNGAYMDTSVDMAKSNANVSIFNDEITGTSSTHTIVGDQLAEFSVGNRASSELDSEFDITGSEEGDSGSDNTVVIHSDSLAGGENSEIIVGDIMSFGADSVDGGNSIGISVTSSFSGDEFDAKGNVFSANDDIIDGSAGTHSQLLVGDIAYLSDGSSNSPVRVSSTLEFTASLDSEGVEYSNNKFSALNDLMIGGSGNDIMAGDLFLEDDYSGSGDASKVYLEADVQLDVNSDVDVMYGGYGNDIMLTPVNGGTIENNEYSFHDDIMDGGAGNDIMSGDAIVIASGENEDPLLIKMTVDLQYEASGAYNTFGDELVTAQGGTISNNSYSAFNDILRGDDGSDDGPNNGDILVGDLLFAGNSGVHAVFDIDVSYNAGSDEATNGTITGNTVDAWNDTLIGGAGGDVLVGDAMFLTVGDAENYLYVEGHGERHGSNAENDVTAFSDVLCGGEGNDTLIGDFLGVYTVADYSNSIDEAEFDIVGEDGKIIGKFFEDTLRGDAGDDVLIGQLGNDTLEGGEGADRFVYEGSDSWETSFEKHLDGEDHVNIVVENNTPTRSEGNDVIKDFNFEEGDTIDLDAMFDKLGISNEDTRAYQINIEGNVLTVEGVDNFSITVMGDTLPDVAASTNMTSDELAEIGIIVGGGDVS
ncbi:hypothetical protein A9Q83_13535 [Alphaproteobacteria bacterium 46_93_T64]|nr:hypothetical protein A9Q83_13535 [Alphaproteobacteria bacterium 46_93_T64]